MRSGRLKGRELLYTLLARFFARLIAPANTHTARVFPSPGSVRIHANGRLSLVLLFLVPQAVKLKPRFCDAYNNLASAYMQLGHTQEAIETYQVCSCEETR